MVSVAATDHEFAPFSTGCGVDIDRPRLSEAPPHPAGAGHPLVIRTWAGAEGR
jgi:hypothetical protein